MTTPSNIIADRLAKETGSWSSISYKEHEENATKLSRNLLVGQLFT